MGTYYLPLGWDHKFRPDDDLFELEERIPSRNSPIQLGPSILNVSPRFTWDPKPALTLMPKLVGTDIKPFSVRALGPVSEVSVLPQPKKPGTSVRDYASDGGFSDTLAKLQREGAERRRAEAAMQISAAERDNRELTNARKAITEASAAAKGFARRATQYGIQPEAVKLYCAQKRLIGYKPVISFSGRGWKIKDCVPMEYCQYEDEGMQRSFWSQMEPGAYVLTDGRLIFGNPPRFMPDLKSLAPRDLPGLFGSWDYKTEHQRISAIAISGLPQLMAKRFHELTT